jgi:hypothetical protein
MEKQTKIIIGIIAGVVVVGTGIGIGVYYHNKNKQGGDKGDDKGGDTKGGGTSGNSDTPTSEEVTSTQKLKPNDTIIKIGSYGKSVAIFQAILNYKFGANLTIDGKFGGDMVKAIRKLNPACGMGATVVGVGIGDTECDSTKLYKALLIKFGKDPAFVKYLKADKGIQKVFAKYQ